LEVLFYRTATGNEVVLDFIRSFPADERKIIGGNLRTVQIGFPMGLPLCDHLGSGLYEVRTSLPSRLEVRLIFFQQNDAIVIVHGIIKKTRATPQAALDLAIKRKREFSS
jgi:phage-related protein